MVAWITCGILSACTRFHFIMQAHFVVPMEL